MDINDLAHIPSWDWPEEASATVLATLRDRDASEKDRRLAADLAGDVIVMNDEVADTLLGILADPDETPFLRGRAAISLGPVREELWLEEGDPFPDDEGPIVSELAASRISRGLHAAWADRDAPKEIRRRALEASVRAPEDWHEQAIREAYASDDAEWKMTAVFCMRYTDGFDDQILASLNDEDPRIEIEAVRAAGVHELRGAWKHVSRIVQSDTTDKSLLLAAIQAVGLIRPDEAGMILDELLDEDDAEIQAAIDEALAHEDIEFDDDDDDDMPDFDPMLN